MRLRRSLASGITAAVAAALAIGAAGALPASDAVAATAVVQRPHAAQPPTCSEPSGDRGFPIGTRIKGGPAAYEAGGGFRTWSVELGNTTRGSCENIHPVVVIVDKERELRPRQVQLEFHDGTNWRPVRFERTDRDENVGVFDDEFPGFTVEAGRTLTVKVRLSFTSEAHSERAVISAAVVQRRADDGDWVGESEDYPFGISTEAVEGEGEDVGGPDGGRDGGGVGPDTGASPGVGRDGGSSGGRELSDSGDSGGFSYADELAATGPRALLGVSAVAAALFATGWALVAGTRRLRAAARRR
ncbi:hypothetical protein [Streptomyces sp. NPDC051218]|uniref:hypothetical protein n=1 Tax=Streptomyces sp. NPDC051218 TaxID=3365645 RepID=UPI00379D15DD